MCLGERSKKRNPGARDASRALVVVKRRNRTFLKKNRSPSDSRFERGRVRGCGGGTGMGEVVNLEWARWLILVSKVCITNEIKHTWGSRCVSSPSLRLRVLLLILNPSSCWPSSSSFLWQFGRVEMAVVVWSSSSSSLVGRSGGGRVS